MNIIDSIRNELSILNQKFIDEVENYDFWNKHIKYVVKNAIELAEKYGADKEIVELGALLHDVALVSHVGTKADHHINGAKIAESILKKYAYPEDRMKRVVGCVLHHRSSHNATNIDELCVADADILAHFDNIPLCFEMAYTKKKFSMVSEIKLWLEKDFNDLSEKTKEYFRPRFETIMDVLFGKLF